MLQNTFVRDTTNICEYNEQIGDGIQRVKSAEKKKKKKKKMEGGKKIQNYTGV